MAQVLLVEAEPSARDDLRAMLVSGGHRVDMVTSADMARRAVSTNEPDIVISSFTLPDGSGLDLLDDLEHRGTKTVTIVPQREPQTDQLLVELRDDAYFCQPYSGALLMEIVATQAAKSLARRTGRNKAEAVAARLWPHKRDKLRA